MPLPRQDFQGLQQQPASALLRRAGPPIDGAARTRKPNHLTLAAAQLLLKLLRLRGFVVPEALEQRIAACQDIACLERWAGRLLTAGSLAEVLSDELP